MAEPGGGSGFEAPKSEVARQELEALKARAAQLEAQLNTQGVPQEHAPKAALQQAVAERWAAAAPQQKTVDAQTMGSPEAIQLKLSPEEHDAEMGHLIGILQEKGVTHAIHAAEASNNPHLIDDFHRVLIEYLREGFPARQAASRGYKVPLSLVLYEVTLPASAPGSEQEQKMGDPTQKMREFISLMEGFYRGMQQMDAKSGEYFSFEIANPAGAQYTSIYVAVPKARAGLFEKQITSLYPSVRLTVRQDDYNAFAKDSQIAAAIARQAERPIFSLRTFGAFPSDPLEVLLNSFSKLDATGEGAAIQFVISPRDQGLSKRFRRALEKIRSGTPLEKAIKVRGGFWGEVLEFFSSTKKLPPEKRLPADDPRIKNIEGKVGSPIFYADIRVVASAATQERAQAILSDIEAPFQQFEDTFGNKLVFASFSARYLRDFAHAFSYRLLDERVALPLSGAELATMAHLPRAGVGKAAPDLKQEKSQAAPPPIDLPQMGTLLGVSKFRGTEAKVFIQAEDRLRHLYLIGQTGTGKSALLKNIVAQDILSGAGVCFIDPHGTDVLDILSIVPPERIDDVIYFDPGSTDRPMGLNMLEYDESKPEQKTLVVDELLGIFKKLFGAVPESMGPAFEQYFRNAALLVMEDPSSGNTLLDISRVFADADFRARKLAACKNPIVARFWNDIASQATGDQALANYAPYVTNKFDAFTTNEIIRPIIAQQRSAFNFRELMDTRKILLVNLAKGRIGELNANLLGLVIVGKFLIAALSRADSFGKDLPPFYLHIDEFQNFATPSIATILSEARKYKLSLTVAHQFIAQLTEEIRNAVFGNVGSIAAFRIGAQDAETLEKQFMPVFTAQDLIRVDNFNAHLKLLVGGKPMTPFNIETLPFQSGGMDMIAQMQELSALKYGRPRARIEAEIAVALKPTVQEDPTALARTGV
jgi:hypothetical protein